MENFSEYNADMSFQNPVSRVSGVGEVREKTMTKRAPILALTMACLLFGPALNDAEAVRVTWNDGATIHTVFEDNIEGPVRSDMSAIVGTWNGITQFINGDLSAFDGPPGPVTGDVYVERHRGPNPNLGGGTSLVSQEAIFDLSANGGQALSSGIVNVQFAYWIPVTHGEWQSLVILDSLGPGGAPGQPNAHSYILRNSNMDFFGDDVHETCSLGNFCSGTTGNTGASVLLGQWNKLEVIADLDNNTTEVLVNNVSGGAYHSLNDASVARLVWRSEGGNFGHYIDSVIFTPQPDPTMFTWNGSTPGDWNSNGNWITDTTGGSPDGNNHEVTFDAMGSTGTVATDTAVTVNRITFDNASSYFIAGGGQVNLAATTDASMTDPALSVLQGNHEFQVDVGLDNDLTVNVANGAVLEFDNQMFLNGNTLTKTGAGAIEINNNITSGGGALDCQEGICSGSGTIGGDLTNDGGIVSPGNLSGASVSVVPEPTSLILLVLGMLGASWRSRR